MKNKKDIFKDLFIFEMANNHNGRPKLALEIVGAVAKIAKKHNITAAVKLQYRNMDTFIHPAYRDREDIKQIPRFINTELAKEEYSTIIDAIKSVGLLSMCTPFDEDSVKQCMDDDVDIIKIASCGCEDWPLIEAAAATGKPIVISFGGHDMAQLDKVYSFLLRKGVTFAMLHCVAEYPVKGSEFQLDILDKMVKRFPKAAIGYSGHEEPGNHAICQIAAAKGATVFERHIGIAKGDVKLNAYSLGPSEMEQWIKSVKYVRDVCKLPDFGRKISAAEDQTMQILKRGVYLNRPVRKGETISFDDVFFAIPCMEDKQLNSGTFKGDITATKDYAPGDPLTEEYKTTPLMLFRSAVHHVKGLLNEVGIPVGENAEAEVYHHYGMENIWQTGAFFINIVNREYCKRLVVMLPNQQYPLHHHNHKEETFQVLHGEMVLHVEGKEHKLSTSDIFTVFRGDIHSFSSEKGVIFEEISTAYIRDDSIYVDKRIAETDPIIKKTVLKDW